MKAIFIVSSVTLAVLACRPSEAPLRSAQPLPQVSGTLAVDGLQASVRVVRDTWGVPHIFAGNRDDLFFAQGFVQAQDRLFQMDLWRRGAQGRLSEVLGANFIERDAMTRRIQYRGDLEREWASYGPDAEAVAGAFTRGINAWVSLARESLPEEFVLAGWIPDLWQPGDLLNRTDAFVASGSAHDELFRAQLVAAVGAERADALLPLPDGVRTIVPRGLDMGQISLVLGGLLRGAGAAPFFSGFAAPFAIGLTIGPARVERPESRLGAHLGIGSNAWVVGPRATGGGALLAVDPHRPLLSPSLRYLVHLQAPGWHVAGATAPWQPGVAIGHNDWVAWGFAASAADTADIYVERLNPSNPYQVLDRERWVDLVVEKEAVVVKGRSDPFEAERLYSRNGVVIAMDREQLLAYVLRWSGAEPGAAGEFAALALNRARSLSEFREALTRWKLPAAEFVYADIEGNIGLQLAGAVPVRGGWSGALPVPGWSGAYDWRGWTPLDSLPRAFNASDYVTAANASDARMNRIRDLLTQAASIGREEFERFQHDTVAWNAEQLVPLLRGVRSDRLDVEQARQGLLAWDKRLAVDSVEASLYVRWEAALQRRLAESRLPPELTAGYLARGGSLLVSALVDPSPVWFDGQVGQARDRLLAAALGEAVDRAAGSVRDTVTFAHSLGISERTRGRFDVGPFPMPGYAETVLSFSYPSAGPQVGPSFRAILDPEDWDRSVVINAPGQSEATGSRHFEDLAKLWAGEQYVPLPFSDAAVQANAASTLLLIPSGQSPSAEGQGGP